MRLGGGGDLGLGGGSSTALGEGGGAASLGGDPGAATSATGGPCTMSLLMSNEKLNFLLEGIK